MNADKIIDEIRKALGNPSSGPLANAMPLIAEAVHTATEAKPVKEARVVKAAETREEVADK